MQRRNLIAGIVVFLACFCQLQSRAIAQTNPEIVSLKKIWDQGRYNSFTDLIRYQNRWWCTFREAEAHAGGFGKIRIIVSDDGDAWTSAALLAEDGFDLRDPKLSVTPGGKLMCLMGAQLWSHDGKNTWDGTSQHLTGSPRVAFSEDGLEWTVPKKVLAEDHWLWRATTHNQKIWSMSKMGAGLDPRRLMLFTSTDGIDWQWVTEPRLPDNIWEGSETTLRFLADDTMVALTRPSWIGTSKAPYREWKWTRLPVKLGGPNFIQLPDGSLWGSARLYGPKKTTVLARMTPTSFEPELTLPSSGDNSYPGMVWHDDLLWLSYYSAHEGKPEIYLAKIRMPLQSTKEEP